MEKGLFTAVCIFVLNIIAQEAAAQDERFSTTITRNQPQMLTVANMVPDNFPAMATSPTAIVNASLNARPDAARLMPKLHRSASAAASNPTQSASSGAAMQITPKERTMSAAEQARLKNYAPFMRNLVMSADHLTGAMPQNIKAARVTKGGKQVIVLGGP